MGRGGVSAVAHGAKLPHVAAYEHILVEEQRREWEHTKEDLGAAKKQIAEKDDLILQLKTQVRKLQETLQKKDKDLQAAFAVLRTPQDAELTKKRKQELIDRLVMENQQRVVNAEAIAEERKKELDRLKYSSKFLRCQELEVELEEYRKEIERLRAMSAASASPSRHSGGVVVGKLKLSAALGSTAVTEGDARYMKTNKTPTVKPHHGASIRVSSANNNITTKAALRWDSLPLSDPRSTISGKGKVLLTTATKPPDPARKKESFVSKTRRRAQEAEYFKQVRLAQLEAECELEENIHIRTAREVRARLEEEKKSREQQREAAAIREKIAALQQLRAVPEDEEEQQQNNAVVITLEFRGDPTTAAPAQDKAAKKLEPVIDEKNRPPSAGESELGPGEAVGPVPDHAEEQEAKTVSSPPIEPVTQPGEVGKIGDDDDVKASEGPDLYENFSEDPKQQDQVTTIQVKGEPDATHMAHEATLAARQNEIEHSKEGSGSEDGYLEEHDVDAEIEEVSTKDSDSPVKLTASHIAVDDPLEISDAEDEQEDYKSDAVAGGADLSGSEIKVVAADNDQSLGEDNVEDQPAKEPISSAAATIPNAVIPVSDHLYDEENFGDDPKEQDDEPEQTGNEAAEQHRQGFLIDVVDPHIRLDTPEAANEPDTHDSSAHEYCQGFLVDVVDPHAKVVIQDSEPLDADVETQQEANGPKEPSGLKNSGSSVDDFRSRVEIAAESNPHGPSDAKEERSEPNAGVVDSGEIGSPVSTNVATADEEPSASKGNKSSSDGPVLDSVESSSVVVVEHEQPLQCFAQDPADAIPAQTGSDDVHSDNYVLEHTASVVESNEEVHEEHQPKAEYAGGDIIEKQIASGIESADHMSDYKMEESVSILSSLHLTAAELEEAMHAAARKIQQFWRQMDAHFRRALNGGSASSDDVTTAEAPLVRASAIVSPSAEEAKASEVVKEEEKEEEEHISASGSEATSPSYTPYSTPRDAESNDQHSQSHDS